MKLKIKPKALSVIDGIAAFVESKNTKGSGSRYILKFIEEVKRIGQINVQYALCNHPLLNRLKYSCRTFNNWVIVFRIEDNALIVYDIIPSSMLF